MTSLHSCGRSVGGWPSVQDAVACLVFVCPWLLSAHWACMLQGSAVSGKRRQGSVGSSTAVVCGGFFISRRACYVSPGYRSRVWRCVCVWPYTHCHYDTALSVNCVWYWTVWWRSVFHPNYNRWTCSDADVHIRSWVLTSGSSVSAMRMYISLFLTVIDALILSYFHGICRQWCKIEWDLRQNKCPCRRSVDQ